MQTKILLFIDTRDRLYTKRLADYLTKYFSDSMNVITNMTELTAKEGENIVLLSDYRDPAMESWPELSIKLSKENGIDPYQSARDIGNQILEAWREHLAGKEAPFRTENETVRLEKKTGRGLISVFGTGGGIGKTTFSLALALALGEFLKEEERVLLFSLTGFPAQVTADFGRQDALFGSYPKDREKEGQRGLGRLLFSLAEESPGKTKERIQSTIKPLGRAWEKLDYLDSPAITDDLWELDQADLSRLLKYLKEVYPYVLMDLGTMPIKPVRQILRESDSRLYVLEATAEGRSAFEKLCPVTESNDRLVLIQSLRLEGKAKMAQDKFETLRPGEFYLPRQAQLYAKEGGVFRMKRSGPYFDHVREIAGSMR
ncbi:MAG: hypothetical protein J6P72_03810 [Firmicutes bacterium]|nr:hypothetical protein [Bacillota bacterium]